MVLRRSAASLLALAIACTGSGTETTRSTLDDAVPTATASSPSSSEVFASLSPSLAFVATSLASGSGILIEEELVLTNAHVVWPFRSVEIVFSNGTRGVDLPVVAVDWVADLALIDVSTLGSLPGHAQLTASSYATGDDVYLIGYPADDSDQPAPAITSGLISRTRSWRDGDLTFIQSDALISGGQSGGALVARSGSIIGITSLEVGDGFALALDARDVRTRIDAMLNGSDVYGIGDRWPDSLAVDEDPEPPVHGLDETVFVIDAVPGELISIVVSSESVLSGSVIGPDGFLETTLEAGSLEFTPELAGPHFVSVVPDGGQISALEVSASVNLRLLSDPDRDRSVAIGSVHFGNIDYPGDLDWFSIELERDQTVAITASSPNADMALIVGPASDPVGSGAESDSDSGAGVIGSDAELRYTAPESGEYIIGVFDETQFGPGAYALRIEER